MYRSASEYLRSWKYKHNRKPLVIRGARQVGKSYLVRSFAAAEFENLIELNLDDDSSVLPYFERSDSHEIIRLLEVHFGRSFPAGKTLLFLDEIQGAPDIIPLLRYFYENKPELHVIAAGSLLEFVLSEHTFSMPVGRIEYMFMGPMSFQEFLLAGGREKLVSYLNGYTPREDIPRSIHEKLLDLLKAYCLVGGMPAVVREYFKNEEIKQVAMEQRSILQTYSSDFIKYRRKINARLLETTFRRIPALVGQKLKYVNIERNEKAKNIADCINMLQMARVVYCVTHSSGNGIPLGAEVNHKVRKMLFLDVGLLGCALGVKAADIYAAEELTLVNSGAVAEQFAGQHLLYQHESYVQPELYYWNREKRSSSAEVDYLYEHGGRVVPVEIKSGKTGRLKSLQVFAAEKNISTAVRFNMDVPSYCRMRTSVAVKPSAEFGLLSLPLYLIEEMDRLLGTVGQERTRNAEI
jgi:predicted AAA+ superfamily ATPase